MYEITLEGLSPRQRFLADILWQFDNRQQIVNFVNSLPTAALKQECAVIIELMIAAAIDQEQSDHSQQQAQEAIQRARR